MADSDVIYELAAKVESNIDIDKRVAALQSLQADLEAGGYVVEADAVTSAIKTALKQSNHILSNTSLAFVPTYASLIYAGDGSETHALLNHNVRTLINSVAVHVIDKLGDQKERIRESARTALVELCNTAYSISSGHLTTSNKGKDTETPLGIFERTVREHGLAAKSPRTREQTVLLLPVFRQNCDKYPVKPLLPITVDLLSDADGTVREGARNSIVALFSNATPGAKTDLKKELEKRGTRKQTAEAILREVLASPSAALDPLSAPETLPSRQSQRQAAQQDPVQTQLKVSTNSVSQTSASSAAASAAADDIRPVYIASRSDLERTFTAMLPCYEGRESEHNWLNREQSMIKIRGLIVSGAHRQFGEAVFVGQIKVVQEGILKSVASLRTTLSMHAVHLVSELAIELGDYLAPCVEGFVMALIAMAGFTKKLIANATQESVAAIMINVSMRPLFLQLIWQGYQDKNVATRAFAAEHLCTILIHHAPFRKHAIEAHGGLDFIEKCLRKGASDSNPLARTTSRKAFWIFHQHWTEHANAILNSFDPATKKQVMATAPTNVDVEAVVEQKPKTAVPLRAKPGGASSAILQAKRAAAMKATQERERQKAEAAAAAHEDRLAAARQAAHQAELQAEHHAAQTERQQPHMTDHDDVSTPVPAQKRSGGFMPSRQRVTSQAKSAYPLHVAISPEARHRIETAIAVPLPTSPSEVPESKISRGTSYTSAKSSDNRPPEPYAGGRQGRAISSSSYPSHSFSATTSDPSTEPHSKSHGPSLTATSRHGNLDLADLSLNNADEDEGDVTQQPRTSANGLADDTVQLGAPEDASMDLIGMELSSPFKLPSQAGAAKQSGRDAAVENTPQAKPRQQLEHSTPQNRGPTNGRQASESSLGGTPRSATPGTAVKRSSGLPRPVSMPHSPSISPEGPESILSTSSASSKGLATAQGTSARDHLKTVSAASSSDSPSEAASMRSSSRHTQSTTSDSWMFNKATRLEQTPPANLSSSPVKSRPETWDYIQALSSGTADLRVFRKLAKLSSEFKVADSELNDNVLDDALSDAPESSSVLQKGPLSTKSGAGKPGMLAEEQEGFASGTLAWQHAGLFDSLFAAVKLYLVPETASEVDHAGVSAELKLSAQVLLHRLVENQYPLFPASGRELELLDMVMLTINSSEDLITLSKGANSSSSARVVTRKASLQASESVLACWAAKVDPILGFDMLRSLLQHHQPPSSSTASTVLSSLALRSGFSTLLLRLPSELVLEDFLPRLKPMLADALTSPSADARLNATTLLKKLNDKFKTENVVASHDRIFTTLDLQNNKSLMDLLMYYLSKK